jgi:hypothetical protein
VCNFHYNSPRNAPWPPQGELFRPQVCLKLFNPFPFLRKKLVSITSGIVCNGKRQFISLDQKPVDAGEARSAIEIKNVDHIVAYMVVAVELLAASRELKEIGVIFIKSQRWLLGMIGIRPCAKQQIGLTNGWILLFGGISMAFAQHAIKHQRKKKGANFY